MPCVPIFIILGFGAAGGIATAGIIAGIATDGAGIPGMAMVGAAGSLGASMVGIFIEG